MSQFAPSFRDMPMEPAQVVFMLKRQLGPDGGLVELTIPDARIWDISSWKKDRNNPAGFSLYYRQYNPHSEVAQFYIRESGDFEDGYIEANGKRRNATVADLHAAIVMLQGDELLLDVKLPKVEP